MSNEPVAWAVWEGRPHDVFLYKEEADELCRLKGGDAKSVPLYTHPAKTLTDEEKDEIIAEFMGEYYKGDIVLHQMISAILRKAQEK
jgi:hypothetical protein